MVYNCLGRKELATGDVDDEDDQLISYTITIIERYTKFFFLIADLKYHPQQFNAIILNLSLATNEADVSRRLSI